MAKANSNSTKNTSMDLTCKLCVIKNFVFGVLKFSRQVPLENTCHGSLHLFFKTWKLKRKRKSCFQEKTHQWRRIHLSDVHRFLFWREIILDINMLTILYFTIKDNYWMNFWSLCIYLVNYSRTYDVSSEEGNPPHNFTMSYS